jgi:hypothetical protein
MRLLLALREINWLAVIALLAAIAAVIITYTTNPPLTGPTLALAAIALAKLSEKD